MSSWIGTLFPLELIEVFKEPPRPRPDPCLTCPPFELIERYLLGGITREMLVIAEKLDDGSPPDGREIDEGVMLEAFFGGAKLGLTEVQEHFRASLRRGQRLQRVFAEQLLRLPEPATFLSGRQD